MNSYTRPQQKENVLARDLEDEMLLYDRSRKAVHVLNATAAAIWKLCDGRNSILEIAELVAQNHEMQGEVCVEKDVAEMLSTFGEMELLRSDEGGAKEELFEVEAGSSRRRSDRRNLSEGNSDRSEAPSSARSQRQEVFAKRILLD